MAIPFIKMHGLGNDFVILIKPQLPEGFMITPAFCQALSDRRKGIGCDQIILMEGIPDNEGIHHIAFYNADGSESGACGNGTRCIAGLIFEELKELADEEGVIAPNHLIIQVKGINGGADRRLQAWIAPEGLITVDMGMALLHAPHIPTTSTTPQNIVFDTLPLPDGIAVGMGNPHCVFFVSDQERASLCQKWGSVIEKHPLFPHHTNVEFATALNRQSIRVSVWERGVGMTQACGTGACAVVVASVLQGLTDRAVVVHLDGGSLHLVWDEETGHVYKTGSYTWVAEGIFAWPEEDA